MSKKHLIITGALIGVSMFSFYPVYAATAEKMGRGISRHDNLLHKNAKRGIEGTVSSVGGTVISLATGSSTYSVDASNARIVEAGKIIPISGISIGDRLLVSGKVSGSTIVANHIIDGMPILPPNNRGNFAVGIISSVNGGSFVVETPAKGRNATTTSSIVTGSSTIFKKDGKPATIADVTSGLHVSVKGTKDSSTGVISAVSVNISSGFKNFINRAPGKGWMKAPNK